MPNPVPPQLDLGRFQKVRFKGKVLEPRNVSGVARVPVPHGHDLLVLGSDETELVQVLRQTDDPFEFKVLDGQISLREGGGELDIEGVAADGNTVYVTGSHAQVRKKSSTGHPLGDVSEPNPASTPGPRDWVFRITLAPDGKPVVNAAGRPDIAAMSLRGFLDHDPILKRFRSIPSKENGIDIEGLAAYNGDLYFGFRGPVLRENWVPILRCRFGETPQDPTVTYVQLDGRGVRDLVPFGDGFLILAGPVGDGDATYRLYRWDGRDGLTFGSGVAATLAEFPPFENDDPERGDGKPESITVLHAKPTGHGVEYDLLLVCDGLHDGGPVRFQLTV